MAGRSARRDRARSLTRRVLPVLRLGGRIVAASVALLIVGLVVVQFARVIGENVHAAHELAAIRSDIIALQKRRVDQQAELRRLSDPQGAVPEIHDRLRLVRPNETIILVSPAPPAVSSPAP